MEEVTVLTVLRSGKDFLADHVLSIHAQVKRHLRQPFRFVCLTDMYVPRHTGIQVEFFEEGWPGWWSKLELYRYTAQAPDALYFYLDLDTVLLNDFTVPETNPGEVWLLPDFYAYGNERYATSRWWATGLMCWRANLGFVWEQACRDGYETMERVYQWDQIYLNHATKSPRESGEIVYKDITQPITVESYKKHALAGENRPLAQIVCFHGKPRPWAVEDSWVKEARNGTSD